MAKRSGCPPYVKAGRIRHLVLASGGVRLSTRRLRDRSETTQGLRFEALRRLVNKEPAQRTGGEGWLILRRLARSVTTLGDRYGSFASSAPCPRFLRFAEGSGKAIQCPPRPNQRPYTTRSRPPKNS